MLFFTKDQKVHSPRMSRIWSDLEDPTPPGFLPPRRSLEAALSVAPQTASWWTDRRVGCARWTQQSWAAGRGCWVIVSWTENTMKNAMNIVVPMLMASMVFSNIGLFYFHWPTTHNKIQQWLSWIIAETKARPKSCRATEGQLVHDAPWWHFDGKITWTCW